MMSRLALALLVALNVTPAWSMPRGSGAPPTVMRVNDFYSKFGWNTSLHNGSTVSEIETNLATLGHVNNIRDTMWNGPGRHDLSDR